MSEAVATPGSTQQDGARSNAAATAVRPRPSGIVMSLTAAALAGEIVLFALGATGMVPSLVLLAAHLALVVLFALCVWRPMSEGSDGGLAVLSVLATLCVGPFGAAGALLLPVLARGRDTDSQRLQQWYERIALSATQDEMSAASDRIAIGRIANLGAPAPSLLAAEFASGSLAAQQTALGMIARNFDPAYLPVLAQALESPEPVIRVQAAAVAARVRDILRRDMPGLLAKAVAPQRTHGEALARAAAFEATARSGLLESGTAHDATRIADGLRARVMAALDVSLKQRPAMIGNPRVADAYLAQVLSRGNSAEFRAARLRVRNQMSGRYRRRPLSTGRGIFLPPVARAGVEA